VTTGHGIVIAQAYFPSKGLTPAAGTWDLDAWTRRHKPAFLRQLRP